MRKPKSLQALEELGRVQLSRSFFMRNFLYSEVANFYGRSNMPEDPDLAIAAGRKLCQKLLQPLHDTFGAVEIRSGYRSPTVNKFCAEHGHNCSPNEGNYARHIWDRRDGQGNMGAVTSVVLPWYLPRYAKTGDWRPLAWWIHDHLPYSELQFFRKLAAFNIGWRENPKRTIYGHTAPRGFLTKPGMANHEASHGKFYRGFPRLRRDTR
ncbi:MAG: hypothetical protein O7A65_10645 [Proteobacteria bacterium]|nr:hypothetical protein [Pseudomonadota bacterium]